MDAKKTSVIYIRTSTKEQSPELQLTDISNLNPPDDALILEEQQSAFKDNVVRPHLEYLFKLISSGKVNEIYVWDLDRIYRNRLRLCEFFILCKVQRITIHSYNQKWLEEMNSIPPPFNDIVKDLLISITGWTGEEESKKKSNRVKMAVRRTEEGTLSYKGKKWGRKPLSKQTITRVLELHNAGSSIRAIANAVQIYDKNNNGRPISKSAVHKIISEKTA